MLYILTGPDEFSRSEALTDIKNELGDQEALDSNTTVLNGRQLKPDELGSVCRAMPFLTEKRLVIVEGLLDRFEPRPDKGRQKGTKKANSKQNDCKSFAAAIDGIPDSTVLVLVDGDVKKTNTLYKAFLPQAKIRFFPLLRNNELQQWISKRIAREGGSISPRALGLLGRLVGSNLWLMSGEITKLVLYTAGKRIEEEDVRAVVGYSQQASVFAMVDAILESRASQGQQAIQQLLQAGAAPVY
ncbi:MAG TPA: DNA polymerase III subunit delta, partial [Dehalococcoidia bacterium]|nr:DNA polymerase III subunit delta [Dehalococcoidia bacterium]